MRGIANSPSRKGPERSQAAGFTLLEVMIALAVAAIALASLLGLANRTVGVHGRLQHTTRATQLAQYRMAELETGRRQPVEDAGRFEAPFDAYSWRIDTDSTPFASVRRVTVTVSWERNRPGQAVDLTSFIQMGESLDVSLQ